MTETLHFAPEISFAPLGESKLEENEHAADSRGLGLGLLTFDARFQRVIRESLLSGQPIEMCAGDLPFPENDAELSRFCDRALAECPLKIEIQLLNGRCVQVSFNWKFTAESSSVSVHAADITRQMRSEEEHLALVT